MFADATIYSIVLKTISSVSKSGSLPKLCTNVFTCGLLRVTTHETEPAGVLLTVAEQIKETHLLQIDLQTVHILRYNTHRETDLNRF